MAKSSSTSPRRSTRKRQSPERYGFHPRRKRQRTEAPTCLLDALPIEMVRKSLSFLPSLSDRFSLQTTNKLFRNLSNTPEMIQGTPLFNSPALEIVRNDDSTAKITRRLLPFAKTGNHDALFLLGLMAIYIEDDTELGLALLQKGMVNGDLRCQHEIGNFLKIFLRKNNDPNEAAGQNLIEQAAAKGHAPSRVAIGLGQVTKEERKNLYKTAREDIAATACLEYLLTRKPTPPVLNAKGGVCGNPVCFRQHYNVPRRGVRKWLKWKRAAKGYSEHWKRVRPALLSCGIPFPGYKRGRKRLYFVPPFPVCSICRSIQYCSRACQTLHWAQHRMVCVPPAAAADAQGD